MGWDATRPAPEVKRLPPGTNEPASEKRRSGSLRVALYALAGGAALASLYFARRLWMSIRQGRRPPPPGGGLASTLPPRSEAGEG